MEVAIPFGFRFEADALYTRLDPTEHRFLSPSFGNINRLAANAWEFPLLLKYSWRHGRCRPFAAAGGTFRRIQSLRRASKCSPAVFSPRAAYFRYRIEEPLLQGGMAFGSGVRISAGPLKVTPEVRYTRWTSLRFLPVRNQVEFLVGLGF